MVRASPKSKDSQSSKKSENQPNSGQKRADSQTPTTNTKATKKDQPKPRAQKALKVGIKHPRFEGKGQLSHQGRGYIKGFMDGTMRMLSKAEYAKLFDIKPACLQGHTGTDTVKVDLDLSNEEKSKYLEAMEKFLREDGSFSNFAAKSIGMWSIGRGHVQWPHNKPFPPRGAYVPSSDLVDYHGY